MQKKRAKILLAKMGLDCHDTGIVTTTHMLREAGFEVVYLGLHNSHERILRVAVEEDVDIIGLSFLSGQHLLQISKLMNLMKEKGENFPVMVGGVIPNHDIPLLQEMGVRKVYPPGTMIPDIIGFINKTTMTSV